MNEIYTEADLLPESTLPMGAVITEKDLLPVGADIPSPSPAHEVAESIPMSAAKDIYGGVTGLAQTLNVGAKQAIDIVNPTIPLEENTIYKIGKAVYDSLKAGTFGKEVGAVAKESIIPPLERASEVSGKIMGGDIKGAAEAVARKPFTYTMDVANLLGMYKGGVVAAGKVGKAGASLVFGPSMENISARIANSKVVQEARNYEAIAKDIPSAMETLSTKIKEADTNAWNTLSPDPKSGYSSTAIAELIENTKKEIGKPVSDADVAAVQTLNNYKKRVLKNWKDANISQAETKSLIQSLSDDVDYHTAKKDPTNIAIKNLRHNVDSVLKADNPEYGMAMEPVRKLVRLQTQAQKTLGVKYVGGEYIVPSSTAKNISALNKSFKEHEIGILEDFGEQTGLNIPAESGNFAIKEHFNKPTTQGARRTMAGTVIGGVVGHATGSVEAGAALGSAVGGALDIWGGKALAAGLDTAAPVFKFANKIADKIPAEVSASLLLRGYKQEKKDHPELDDEALTNVVADELKKDPNFYK